MGGTSSVPYLGGARASHERQLQQLQVSKRKGWTTWWTDSLGTRSMGAEMMSSSSSVLSVEALQTNDALDATSPSIAAENIRNCIGRSTNHHAVLIKFVVLRTSAATWSPPET